MFVVTPDELLSVSVTSHPNMSLLCERCDAVSFELWVVSGQLYVSASTVDQLTTTEGPTSIPLVVENVSPSYAE